MNISSKYKIFFILIVLIILIIPSVRINKNEEFSETEKRNLAKFVPVYNFEEKTLNRSFGKDFDNWFRDRFFGRIKAVHLNQYLKYMTEGRFAKLNKITIDKKEKFMHETLINPVYSSDVQSFVYNILNDINTYCVNNNIKFYIVFNPPKQLVYTPPFTVKNGNDKTKEFLQKVNKNNDFNLIFTLDEMLKAKKILPYPVYFKTDSHPTMDGTFVGYKTLMKAVKKDFPNVKILSENDFDCYQNKLVMVESERLFEYGNACAMAGIPNFLCKNLHDTNYRYYKHKDGKNLKTEIFESDNLISKEYYYDKGSDLRIMIFGDSSAENLAEILPYSVKHTKFIRLNGPPNINTKEEQWKILKYYKNEIAKFNPDIITFYVIWDVSDLKKFSSKK